MPSTTYPDFRATTEALTVGAAFPASVRDRTILITGVNKLGIGYTTAEALASQGPRCLILSGRSETKIQECLESLRLQYPDIDYRILLLDLSSQKSVRAAANQVLAWADVPVIDLVINNAGIMNIPQRTLSEDGIELQLATNHVGHFLLTNLLMPKILAAARGASAGSTRIVNVSSLAAAASPLRASDVNWERAASQLPEKERPNFALMAAVGLDANEDQSYIPMAAYGQSKTANVLFTVGLNERLYQKYGLVSIALHPGEMESELQRSTDAEWIEKASKAMSTKSKTLQQGASTTLVAALDPKLGKPGSGGVDNFLLDCQVGSTSPHALEKATANDLWKMTEAWVGEKFSW